MYNCNTPTVICCDPYHDKQLLQSLKELFFSAPKVFKSDWPVCLSYSGHGISHQSPLPCIFPVILNNGFPLPDLDGFCFLLLKHSLPISPSSLFQIPNHSLNINFKLHLGQMLPFYLPWQSVILMCQPIIKTLRELPLVSVYLHIWHPLDVKLLTGRWSSSCLQVVLGIW